MCNTCELEGVWCRWNNAWVCRKRNTKTLFTALSQQTDVMNDINQMLSERTTTWMLQSSFSFQRELKLVQLSVVEMIASPPCTTFIHHGLKGSKTCIAGIRSHSRRCACMSWARGFQRSSCWFYDTGPDPSGSPHLWLELCASSSSSPPNGTRPLSSAGGRKQHRSTNSQYSGKT